MTDILNGASRLHFIVGDPIAQASSPAGVTRAFQDRGYNALRRAGRCGTRPDLASWLAGLALARNVDGIIVTVPHKFACFALCAGHRSERAAFLAGAVDTLRRNSDGSWARRHVRRAGLCRGPSRQGLAIPARPKRPAGGRRWRWLGHCPRAGAGRRGRSGRSTYRDTVRRDSLVQRLTGLGRGRVRAGGANPAGFDIAIDASPVGMQSSDPPTDGRQQPDASAIRQGRANHGARR